MPNFGSGNIDIWSFGSYTTQLLDVSLHANPSGDEWSLLTWREANTEDETTAYCRVDILDSSQNVLQSDLIGLVSGDKKQINLASYGNVKSVDIYVRFKLYGKGSSPIVSDIELT